MLFPQTYAVPLVEKLSQVCAKWCITFVGLCEYVPSGAQLSEASENMYQVVQNFRKASAIMCQVVYNCRSPLQIYAEWCILSLPSANMCLVFLNVWWAVALNPIQLQIYVYKFRQ